MVTGHCSIRDERTRMTHHLSQQAALDMSDSNFEDLILSQIKRTDRDATVWDVLVSDAVRFRTQEVVDRLLSQSKAVLRKKNLHLEEVRAACDAPEIGGSPAWRSELLAATKSRNSSDRFHTLIRETFHDVRHRAVQARRERLAAERVVAKPPTTPVAHLTRGEEGVRRALPALRQLVDQVIAHEEEMSDDPSQADEELWDLLDQITVVMGNTRVTLRQAHDMKWSDHSEGRASRD